MHLMTSGQLGINVSNAHFEETSTLKYDILVSNANEREIFELNFKKQIANSLGIKIADVNILGI